MSRQVRAGLLLVCAVGAAGRAAQRTEVPQGKGELKGEFVTKLHKWICMAAGGAIGLAACSAEPSVAPTSFGPFHAEFEQARQTVTDPAFRAMLADEQISDMELEQAKSLTLRCLADRGYTARFEGQNMLAIDWPDGAKAGEVDEAQAACAGSSFDIIEMLYREMKDNPDNMPRNQLILSCLKRVGVVPQSMTVDQYEAIDMDNPPWSQVDGDVDGCWTDPIGYQGGAPDLVEPPTHITVTVPPTAGG